MKWIFLTFDDLNTKQLYEMLQLRSEVFVVEQDCIYQDMDGLDQKAFHLLGYEEDTLVAYARIFKAGIYFEEASIGRVIVKATYRKNKLGYDLMIQCVHYIQETLKTHSIRISAQQYLIAFYNRLGFECVGKGYLEDGIPHISMILTNSL